MDFGSMKDKLSDAVSENKDKIEQGLDKAGEMAKGRFSGQADKIDQGVDRAKDFLDKHGDKPGDARPAGAAK